ncbi:MAG: hypothetical protein ETSY2_50720 [Candidatus Entotheonella gemina]|uniref:Uncharacterized protein n=1 Tax=Candidatus Entotheonella gemina TaxID=1429439 RepID=W4L756_9BACT|nr:MAG: hypothetical protein ETSY2_50720 [Candidatus Entotheonella gemina]
MQRTAELNAHIALTPHSAYATVAKISVWQAV